MEVSNREVGEQLGLMGNLLEILDENVFKVRAYYRAAEVIGRMASPVSSMSVKELAALDGIGSHIAEKIKEIEETGTFHELEETRAKVPITLIDLLSIEGVGPKTIRTLWRKLSIQSVEDLERAARGHRIRAIKGFGEKKEQGFLKAVALFRGQSGRMTRPQADAVVERISKVLTPGTFKVAGSYRRGKSTVGDIDIVISESPSLLNPRLRTVADEVIEEGDRRTSIRCLGARVDIRFTPTAQFGSMLIYLTGSKSFNIRLREMAMERGLKLNEYGIYDHKTGKNNAFHREEEIFSFLGMDYVVPELREDWGEIEAAVRHALPALVTNPDILGDLHVHSDWSDGNFSLQDLAQEGEKRGYRYLVCSDHSATLGITHGLDAEALQRQQHEIEMINRGGSDCLLVKGVEVDILADGSLGLPDTILGDLDLVIASVHSALSQDIDQMTRRVLSAMENEHVDVIGHPTGRILGERHPAEIDMDRIIAQAAKTGTALECNASPYRLDIDDSQIKEAVSRGVRIAIGTDAHKPADLDYMRFGVTTCRRGWATPDAILNTRPPSEFLEWAS